MKNNKNKSTTSLCIDRCNSSLYWYHPCLPFGQGRPFFDIVFANSALFCLQSGTTWNWLKICPKLRRRCFLAALGAAHRWADNLLATIEFSGWRSEWLPRWTSSATNILSSPKQIQNDAAATIIEQKLDRSEKPRQTLPTFAPRRQPLKVHYLIFSAIQLQLQLRNRNMWVPSRKITVRSVPAIELKNISWSFRQLSHFPENGSVGGSTSWK